MFEALSAQDTIEKTRTTMVDIWMGYMDAMHIVGAYDNWISLMCNEVNKPLLL